MLLSHFKGLSYITIVLLNHGAAHQLERSTTFIVRVEKKHQKKIKDFVFTIMITYTNNNKN